ncbi:PREDICTED: uncharacterized protein LOC105557488 [Vollenhovia emeryi]|uniref:uncharacterized protein LOC105557488 n=1 Tax=Vollenhovia emeryi TaxID=411798 RepID=UPI0005F3CC2A|nr:PREDICTED: uncharacterized protein LOC105557488 [Vollenhovia emeryi]
MCDVSTPGFGVDPLSPILADIVLDDLESTCLNALDIEIPVFYRYVDDIFTIVPSDKINTILETFNSYHPKLKFTYEIEKNNTISFLNVNISRCNKQLITNWYRKPTFSGRYLNYFSNHPRQYKINTITSLVDQAILLSDNRFHDAHLTIVKNILLNNCFPNHLIDKHIKKRLKQLQHDTKDNPSKFDIKTCITIPYIEGTSEKISQTLRNIGLKPILTVPKKLNTIIKRGKTHYANPREQELSTDSTATTATHLT